MNPSAQLELDMEDSCLVKQVLEANLRLTADRWSARSWNKFEEYNEFCKDNEVSNEGRELHGNRFGDLELCCAIGVYLLPTWVKFIEMHPNIRNQLTSFIRETIHLAEVCTVLWLGAALFGIHVTWPYMNLLLELEASHTDLLRILPEMYNQMMTYPVSFAQLSEPGLPALRHSWVEPLTSLSSPYGPKVSLGLQQALTNCDIGLLDRYLKELCCKQAEVLKRQRGAAYGFDSAASIGDLVTNQVDEAYLDKAPTHTKAVENLFGEEDMILSRFGNQAFEKSSDDLVIKYSKDMLDQEYSWSSQKMRRKTREVDKLQKEFSENQKDLIANGVTPAEAIQITAENRIQRVVQQCRRSHGGPISEEGDLTTLVDTIKDEKKLKVALTSEIRYRKFTLLKVKESNPLFKQRNLSTDQLSSNLRILLKNSSLDVTCSVSLEDLDKVVGVSDEAVVDSENNDAEMTTLEESTDCENGTPQQQAESSYKAGPWPPKIGDHLAVNFEDGFYLGEVIELVSPEVVKISYMLPKKISTASTELNPRIFWFWPSRKDLMDTHQAAVLPLRPVLTIASPPSTKRFVVFKLENLDFIEKFAEL